MNLNLAGDRDPSVIIKGWNTVCSSTMQLVGRKSVAVRFLFEKMSSATLNLLLGVVSEYGWDDCPFNEETLSSKRIYPGHTFRVDSKAWTARQVVSEKSLHLLCERVIWEHRKNGGGKGLQRTEKEVAERSAQSAVICSFAAEIQRIIPVTDKDLEEHLVDKWRKADFQVDVELKAVMGLHEDKFSVRDLQFMKDIYEKTVHPTGAMAHNAEQISVQAAELESSTFELLMRQIKYDSECFTVYLQKLSSYHRALYFRKLEWGQEQHRTSFKVARSFLDRNTALVQMDSPQATELYHEFGREIRKNHNLDEDHLVRREGGSHDDRHLLWSGVG
jgi:hypothetical protein